MDLLREFPVLHTARLLLRAPAALDAPHVFITRSDPVFARHTGIPRYNTVQQASGYIERVLHAMQQGETLFWVIEHDGGYQGSLCLWGMDPAMQRAEIGYDLLPGARGKGYISEALRAVFAHAFFSLPLMRIEAKGVHPENEKSYAVLRRAGFIAAPGTGNYYLERDAYIAAWAAKR